MSVYRSYCVDDGCVIVLVLLFLPALLTVLSSLVWHSLNNNNVGDDGAAAMAEGLKVNSSITKL